MKPDARALLICNLFIFHAHISADRIIEALDAEYLQARWLAAAAGPRPRSRACAWFVCGGGVRVRLDGSHRLDRGVRAGCIPARLVWLPDAERGVLRARFDAGWPRGGGFGSRARGMGGYAAPDAGHPHTSPFVVRRWRRERSAH
jgi:hypothetical protein